MIELGVVAAVLAIGISFLDLVGAVAAAIAIVVARMAGNLCLVPACATVIRSQPHNPGQVVPLATPEAT